MNLVTSFTIIATVFAVFHFMGKPGPSDSTLGAMKQIDGFVTGVSVSAAQYSQWKINNRRYLECGMCVAEMQPFPGEIEEDLAN